MIEQPAQAEGTLPEPPRAVQRGIEACKQDALNEARGLVEARRTPSPSIFQQSENSANPFIGSENSENYANVREILPSPRASTSMTSRRRLAVKQAVGLFVERSLNVR